MDTFRILVVDDNPEIHEDFLKIFGLKKNDTTQIDNAIEGLLGKPASPKIATEQTQWIIDSAFQGEEALEKTKHALSCQEPYALAFVDIRMPPGWDGIVTIQKLWEADPALQCIICTAHSDYSWPEISQSLELTDNFFILKKPFDVIEIAQLAVALSKKWALKKQVDFQIENLENLVNERTQELQASNERIRKSVALTQATLEATQGGIIVMSQEKEPVIYNQNFLQLWNIPQNWMTFEKLDRILAAMAEQLEEPDLFCSIIKDLSQHPKIGYVRDWKLHSGKIFSLFVHPHSTDNQIIGTVLSFEDVTEHKKMQAQLLHRATHDPLTELPNRVLLNDRIEQAITQAKRHHLSVAVLILDLDDFKMVNDSRGHAAGDNLLKLIAERLNGCVRKSDTVARLSGDEFVVVFGNVSESTANLSEKCAELIGLFEKPFDIPGGPLYISVSIGASVWPKDADKAELLLKYADNALYYSKETGKNTYQFYVAGSNEQIILKSQLASDLRMAIQKNNELILHFQPLIHLASGRITGVEALVRWNHPARGLLAPHEFIPLAEETGLILPLGEWVLRTACLKAHEWQNKYPGLTMAVNVSVYQFKQKDFVSRVEKIIQETGINPKLLELEVTESIILENIKDVTQKMMALKQLGLRLAIDDFGTGYASLSYLKFFPFDKVKIDKSFISDISTNREDRSIVEAIIGLTKNMGLLVLAEGVEKQDQIDFLKMQKSNQVQGYYFGKPDSGAIFEKLLEKQSKKEKV